MEVQVRRPADLLAQEPPERPAIDPTNDLADQVPIEQCRLAVGGPRLPCGRLRCQELTRASQSYNADSGAGVSMTTWPD